MNQELEQNLSGSIDRIAQHIDEIIHEKVVMPTSKKLAKELLQRQFKSVAEKMILESLEPPDPNNVDIEFDLDALD